MPSNLFAVRNTSTTTATTPFPHSGSVKRGRRWRLSSLFHSDEARRGLHEQSNILGGGQGKMGALGVVLTRPRQWHINEINGAT